MHAVCNALTLTPQHGAAVLWTPQSEEQALDVAASRISCIVIAIFVMALLAVLIYPQIASELVSLSPFLELTPWGQCCLGHPGQF